MGVLILKANGQSLSLADVTNAAGDTVTVFDDPAMVVSDAEAEPPVVGDEVTLPLAFSTDQTLYLADGPVDVTIEQADGSVLLSERVLISSGIGSVPTLEPIPTTTQIAADVSALGAAVALL